LCPFYLPLHQQIGYTVELYDDSAGSNTALIIGAVVGSICGVILIAVVTVLVCKR
jgi:hypothetical protein